ncbi:hypothetical protein ASD11_09285 [Aeromicrobium sp. Root495]|uniref:tautomerase family protein n=1 Tax=Aeromicrobium sp. Root495 TaxID=1736550 RepID=UPI0006F81D32|nr:tautomerase family protein [Aeromicrobium sp. Root495]KQY59721.1 hypothetical protein ASD11_09285 [Aeromicrobium sp. Root495]
MPSTLIEVRTALPADTEIAMIDAVHDSLVAAFRIPAVDKHVRLVSHAPHRFAVPPHLERPERYTKVTIECFAGRSTDAKRRLYREVVERLETLGVPRDHVTVTVQESPTENWGISGGQAACDVDLGFDIEV